LETKKATQES